MGDREKKVEGWARETRVRKEANGRTRKKSTVQFQRGGPSEEREFHRRFAPAEIYPEATALGAREERPAE